MAPNGPLNTFGENSLIYCGTSDEFSPTASPMIKRATKSVPIYNGSYNPYPTIPMMSVTTKASLRLIFDNKGPEKSAPNAAPMAGKAEKDRSIDYH